MPGFINSQKEKLKGVNNVKFPAKEGGDGESKIRLTVQNLILLKTAIMEIKGEWSYEIKFPCADWGEREIAIGIHCDAGEILTKTGSRSQIGICFFAETDYRTNKMKNFRNWVSVSWVINKVLEYPPLVLPVKYRLRFMVLIWKGC